MQGYTLEDLCTQKVESYVNSRSNRSEALVCSAFPAEDGLEKGPCSARRWSKGQSKGQGGCESEGVRSETA